MGKLTATAFRAAMGKPGTHSDGDGLILKVAESGGASWIVRVQHGGKRRDYGLGSAKLVSLSDARTKAGELRKAVKVEKRDVIAERAAAEAAAVTFKQAALDYHGENEGGWKSAAYGKQWKRSLELYAFPQFGERPAGSIEASDIIAALTPIWQETPETARRVRHRICAVLDYAHAKGWRAKEAPSTMGSLKSGKGLPKQVREKQHRKAMPYADVPAFLATMRGEKIASFGRLALELTVLTATRSVEARAAEWSEFDLKAGHWTIPASRMKRSKSHIVPLSKAALAVLERAAALRIAGTNLVFPGANNGPMSDMTMLKVLRDAKEPYHVHGFRSAFTDWAADRGFPNAVVEAALAHKTPDATQAAYRRTTYLDKRRELMEAWGAYCASGPAAKIVPFKAKQAAGQ